VAKNTPNLTTLLHPRDRRILDEQAGVSWIPEDPKELILPYMDAESEPDVNGSSVEARRKKAREVYDGYSKVIEQCRELEDEIESQCKNCTITLDPARNLSVIEAIRRVFGTDGTQITFAMYKACVKALGEISASSIPKG
jgi:hypothetical protein